MALKRINKELTDLGRYVHPLTRGSCSFGGCFSRVLVNLPPAAIAGHPSRADIIFLFTGQRDLTIHNDVWSASSVTD